jgi:hypothetical protein
VLPRRTVYPPVLQGRADDIWHSPRNVHLRPPAPPIGQIQEGFLIGIQGFRNIWLVVNGTRRSFGNYDAFLQYGLDEDMVLKYKQRDAENNIPTGDDLPPHFSWFTVPSE